MSSFISSNKRVLRLRKRPKETSFKAKTIREPFNKEAIKVLLILVIIDKYNYYIRAIIISKFNYIELFSLIVLYIINIITKISL